MVSPTSTFPELATMFAANVAFCEVSKVRAVVEDVFNKRLPASLVCRIKEPVPL